MSRFLYIWIFINQFSYLYGINDDAFDGSNDLIHINMKRFEKFQFDPRRLQNTTGLEFLEVPLGVGLGTHYAEIYMGSPPQRASVIVDTGSHLTAMPCKTCKDCGNHTDPPYDIDNSKTVRYIPCKEYGGCNECEKKHCMVSQSYAEGSMWKAVMVEDVCWLGALNGSVDNIDPAIEEFGIRFPIGCQVDENGLFVSQKANGIMGMSKNEHTIMTYLLKSGRIEKEIFSMCFHPLGGRMILGGVDYSLHASPIQYAKSTDGPGGWFTVKLLDILIGNESIGIAQEHYNGGRGVIVDSGTTDTYFVTSAKKNFDQVWEKIVGMKFDDNDIGSKILKADDIKKLPKIKVVLEGHDDKTITLEIPPESYITFAETHKYSTALHFSEMSGGVLGASFMMRKDVIFDSTISAVGFANSNCGENGTFYLPDVHDSDQNILKKYRYFGFFILVCAITALLLAIVVGIWRKISPRRWTKLNDPNADISELKGLSAPDTVKENDTSVFTIGNVDDDDDDEEEVEVDLTIVEDDESPSKSLKKSKQKKKNSMEEYDEVEV